MSGCAGGGRGGVRGTGKRRGWPAPDETNETNTMRSTTAWGRSSEYGQRCAVDAPWTDTVPDAAATTGCFCSAASILSLLFAKLRDGSGGPVRLALPPCLPLRGAASVRELRITGEAVAVRLRRGWPRRFSNSVLSLRAPSVETFSVPSALQGAPLVRLPCVLCTVLSARGAVVWLGVPSVHVLRHLASSSAVA